MARAGGGGITVEVELRVRRDIARRTHRAAHDENPPGQSQGGWVLPQQSSQVGQRAESDYDKLSRVRPERIGQESHSAGIDGVGRRRRQRVR